MKMNIQPTKEQLTAVVNLLTLRAMNDVIKEDFDKIEREILKAGAYHYSEHCYQGQFKERGFVFPEDRIIRSPKDIHHMRGISAYGTPAYEGSDCERFYTVLRNKSLERGYIHGENALVRVENDLFQSEENLLKETISIHHVTDLDKFVFPFRSQMLDLLLKLLVPFVKDDLQLVLSQKIKECNKNHE